MALKDLATAPYVYGHTGTSQLAARMRPLGERETGYIGGSHVMRDQWIYSSNFLPYTGEPIEFRLEEREKPIPGNFADGVFHSRWADYRRSRVGSWRSLDSDASALPIEVPTSRGGSFSWIVTRMKNIISRSHGSDLIAPPRNRARSPAMDATSLRKSNAITHPISHGIDSNQMSS